MAVPVFQVTASVVIALFLLRVLQRLLSSSTNGVAQSIEAGLSFLLSGN
jgi:hypothetical protein